MSPSQAPLAVLVARLEHELETLRLAVTATEGSCVRHNSPSSASEGRCASHYVKARDSVARATDLTKQLRESL